MNRRTMLKSSVGLVALLGFLRAALRAKSSAPKEIPYAHLDRLPDDPRVISASVLVADIAGCNTDYGSSMRVLSKALAFLNEERLRGEWRLDRDPSTGNSVTGRIQQVVVLLRKQGMTYVENVRILTHAMGLLSEEHRLDGDDNDGPRPRVEYSPDAQPSVRP